MDLIGALRAFVRVTETSSFTAVARETHVSQSAVTRDSAFWLVVVSGIWGGVGDSKAHADFMRFDRLRLSGR